MCVSTCFYNNKCTFIANSMNICFSSQLRAARKDKLYNHWTKVLQDPDKAVVEIRINGLHIVQRDRFAQQLFVEGQSETSVDVVAVEHRHAHNATHEVEV